MADLKTLPDDIYALFDPAVDHEPSEENLEALANNLKDMMRMRLRKYEEPKSPLRFSALGKKDRQVWYEAHPIEGTKEPMLPKTYVKFMYGAILEEMLLFLTKEAGHSVTDEQREVEVDGVKGHIDAIIDGTVVDAKSASPYGYKKFEQGTVTEDDPFGYVEQLAGYNDVLNPDKEAAWLAIDKVDGSICVATLSPMVMKHHKPAPRIAHLKEVISNEEPPERCYEPIADGKSGNMKLAMGCSYCAHKFRCWPELRGFAYSNGPRYLTTVAKVPDVPEIKL